MKIAICISTRKRPEGILRLLNSINNLESMRNGFQISCISIVENDNKPFTKEIIEKFKITSKFQIKYQIEQRIGISYARNKTVEQAEGADYFFFVDDDQILKSDCINQLIETIILFKCDGAYGNNPPVFNKSVHLAYVNFFTLPVPEVGTLLSRAPTNCLLVSKDIITAIEGPFDLRFNLIGGGDTFFTSLASNKGFEIRSNKNAIAYEIIPENRITINYVYRRAYKSALVKSYQYSYLNYSKIKKINRYVILLMKLTFSIFFTIPIFLTNGKQKFFGIRKLAEALGGLSYILNLKYEIYNKEKFI